MSHCSHHAGLYVECKKSSQRQNFRHLFSEGPLGPGRPCSYLGCPSAGAGDPRRRLAPSGGAHGMSDSFRCSPLGNGVRGMPPEPRALPVVCVGGFISHPLAPLLSPDPKHLWGLGTAVGSRGSAVGFWGSEVGSLPLSSPVLARSPFPVLAGLPAVGNFVGSGPSPLALSLFTSNGARAVGSACSTCSQSIGQAEVGFWGRAPGGRPAGEGLRLGPKACK